MRPWAGVRLAAAVLAACAVIASAAEPPFGPEVHHPPLEPPLLLTGTFGEARSSHFHAGLDLSTGERVGRPVFSPAAGHVRRVRTSGAGYGRALYVAGADGRLYVLAHLDGFAEPIASWVAAVQDSSGVYEQDLWADSLRFPVSAGQLVAWSGRSGTGPPHLHFEIRRGDVALNPLRAGTEVRDAEPPAFRSVTLEPLDDASAVEGSPLPRTFDLAAGGPLTVRARGRLRVIAEPLDRRANGRLTMAPYATTLDWDGGRVECRFDSVSWAEGMSEVDLVYDRGRTAPRGNQSVVLAAPAGFRPRVLETSQPLPGAAGVVALEPGATRRLRLATRDVAGRSAVAEIDLVAEAARGGRAAPESALFADLPHAFATTLPDWGEIEATDLAPPLPGASRIVPGELRFASLPGGFLRVEVTAERWRRGLRALGFAGLHPIDSAAARPGVVLRVPPLPHVEALRLAGRNPRWVAATRPLRLAAAVNGARDSIAGLAWSIPAEGLFEPATWIATTTALGERPAGLAPVGPVYVLEPRDHPLRAPIQVALQVPRMQSDDRLGLYRDDGGGWEFVRARHDSAAGRWVAETRRLGRFALFRDTSAPRVTRRAPPRRPPATPYPTWALEARIDDRGSGVDGRASRLEVDGRTVPSEWDAEEGVLRWRPLRAPAAGRHRYRVVAADRAGNVARSAGTFVLD